MMVSKIPIELQIRYVKAMKNCLKITELKKIHAHIEKLSLSQNNYLATNMLHACNKMGHVNYATLLFKSLVDPNVFSYTAIIRTYAYNHHYSEAITCFIQMLKNKKSLPDEFTFPYVMKSCAELLCHCLGMQIHALVFKFGPHSHSIIENALIDMYGKCGNLNNACRVFDEMTHRDSFSWSSLIFGYATLGKMKSACELFDQMPSRTIVSWTSMISGYARMGSYPDALNIFFEMQVIGIEPNEASILAVLPACSRVGALELGKWIHLYAHKKGFLQNNSVCTALVEMYAECGCIDDALCLFDQLVLKNVISWTTMICGLASHGKGYEAIQLFHQMEKARVTPNDLTFVGVLSACSHAGLWDEGLSLFSVMKVDYHLEPNKNHYGCLVDILGRAGRIDQALDAILKMPMKPDSCIWSSLLNSCRIHGNLEIAVIATQHVMELEPENSINYVLLANIYAELGMWEDASNLRIHMTNGRIKKPRGCSSIEVHNAVQEFVT